MTSIKSLFDSMINLDAKALRAPDIVEQTFSIYPETVLACLDYFEDSIDDHLIKNKRSQLSLLFNEAFTSLRYKVDNQDVHAQNILVRLHDALKRVFRVIGIEKQMIITHALYDSKLPTPELDSDTNAFDTNVLKKMPDISPQLPGLPESLKYT